MSPNGLRISEVRGEAQHFGEHRRGEPYIRLLGVSVSPEVSGSEQRVGGKRRMPISVRHIDSNFFHIVYIFFVLDIKHR